MKQLLAALLATSAVMVGQGFKPMYKLAPVTGSWADAQGRATLKYAFDIIPAPLDQEKTRAEVRRALAEWSKHVQVEFEETIDLFAERCITFRWVKIDGPGGMFAQANFPAERTEDMIAVGDVLFDIDDVQKYRFPDDQRDFRVFQIDVYSLALHEVGHSLGLLHYEDKNGLVMSGGYREVKGLFTEDIASIWQIYAPRAQRSGYCAVARTINNGSGR